ncbi:MAG: metal ABC transporter permease [Simkaniaceae bacterium]|nr:metal ABC transporter permease [Simkaniaceae bacterium]
MKAAWLLGIPFFDAILANPFFRSALLAGLSASIAGGIVGSYVVCKRIVFIAGSIAHSILGGMGVALYISRVYSIRWLKPIHGAFVAALLSAVLIGRIRLHHREREDTVIAALWAFGMSVGVIFTAMTPGHVAEINHFLFGNILWASRSDISLIAGLDLLVLLTAFFCHRRFLALCFDETEARLQRQPVTTLYCLLLMLIAVTVVIFVHVAGVILVIAILSLPAAVANTLTHRLSAMMAIAVILSAGAVCIGLTLSFFLNGPPGATIALVITVTYLLNLWRSRSGTYISAIAG